jgi:pimeloyl-ACP methyl ester carboxylesterase
VTPLVLLHAFPLDARMYDPVRELVRFPLVTPDLPGFGGEPVPGGAPTLTTYALAVLEALERDGVTDFALGGTSMGGYVAMVMVRRWPERIRGLALIDTKASADSPQAADGRRALADRLLSEASSGPLVSAVLPKLLGETTVARRPDLAARVRRQVEAVDPSSAAWAQRAMAARADSFDVLGELTVPSTVVVGAEDVLTPPTDAAAMVKSLAATDLVTIERAGHLTPLESPQRVADALGSLMTRVDDAMPGARPS